MMPVARQPEPAKFDAAVRQPGLAWLAANGIALPGPAPPNTKWKTYWTACLPDLRSAYGAICAYVAVYVELVVGNGSVEHFAPKSQRIDLVYEWDNYRYVCGKMNGRKSNYTDVLDPFALTATPFELNFGDFRVSVSPAIDPALAAVAATTITRLKLNDSDCRKLRENHYNEYLLGRISKGKLQDESPFVHAEAQRQNLL
jgi:hypothetical protein